MVARAITHILVDTEGLFHIGHPDFQKIVQFSRTKPFKIVVPYIAWEERRTQRLAEEYPDVTAFTNALEKLQRRRPKSILGRLDLPPIIPWSYEEVAEASKDYMSELARDNNIELIPLDPAHADRAWSRYFEVRMPFDPAQERVRRREHIPDSWIFECAIDFAESNPGQIALTNDQQLAECFRSIGIDVFAKASEIVALLESAEEPTVPQAEPLITAASKTVGSSSLKDLLETLQQESRNAEQTILGIVGFFGTISKNELTSVLELAGIRPEIAANAAHRLVLTNLIQDTGSALIKRNQSACDLAIPLVESLVAKYVEATKV